MKTIDRWEHLRVYGIEPLTGESCGLSYRILCDVTEKGKRIIAKALGIRDLMLADSWNRGSANDPSVGSILLAPQLLVPIAVFALLETGCTEVWLYASGGLLGVQSDDDPEMIERSRNLCRDSLVRVFHYAGTAGDRNIHVMSGRVE